MAKSHNCISLKGRHMYFQIERIKLNVANSRHSYNLTNDTKSKSNNFSEKTANCDNLLCAFGSTCSRSPHVYIFLHLYLSYNNFFNIYSLMWHLRTCASNNMTAALANYPQELKNIKFKIINGFNDYAYIGLTISPKPDGRPIHPT